MNTEKCNHFISFKKTYIIQKKKYIVKKKKPSPSFTYTAPVSLFGVPLAIPGGIGIPNSSPNGIPVYIELKLKNKNKK